MRGRGRRIARIGAVSLAVLALLWLATWAGAGSTDSAINTLLRRIVDDQLTKAPTAWAMGPIVVLIDVEGASVDSLRQDWLDDGLPVRVTEDAYEYDEAPRSLRVRTEDGGDFGSLRLITRTVSPGDCVIVEWWTARRRLAWWSLENRGKMYGHF
jgi:hypothetical protein